MGSIRCARCGALEDEQSASFSEQGLVCVRCHGDDQASDRAQLAADLQFSRGIANGITPGVFSLLGATEALSEPGLAARASQFAIAPMEGALALLAQQGLRPKRTALSRSVRVGTVEQASVGYREQWVLQLAPAEQASFTTEGLLAQVIKWFRKEIQTGDPSFDSTVYVRTNTPEATQRWLANKPLRELVGFIVAHGGTVSIHDQYVEGEVLFPETYEGEAPQDLLARIVQSLFETA